MWLYFRFLLYICISFKNKHIMSTIKLFWIDIDGDEIECSKSFKSTEDAFEFGHSCQIEYVTEWFDSEGDLRIGSVEKYYDSETNTEYESFDVK